MRKIIDRIVDWFCPGMDLHSENEYMKTISFAKIFYSAIDLVKIDGTWRLVCGDVILNDYIPDGKQDVTRNNLRRNIQNIPYIMDDIKDKHRLYAAISTYLDPLPDGRVGYKIGNHELMYIERYFICHELSRRLHEEYKRCVDE